LENVDEHQERLFFRGKAKAKPILERREDIINFYGFLKMQERKLLIVVARKREREKFFWRPFPTRPDDDD
jgi:hypothetical protein